MIIYPLFISSFLYFILGYSVYQYGLSLSFHQNPLGLHIVLRMLSTIHSITSFSLAMYYQLNWIDIYNFYHMMIYVSGGYFIFDLGYLTITKPKNTLYFQYIFHHLACLTAIYNIGYYPNYVSILYLSEITTPFLNISWYLNKTGNKGKLYLFNGLLIIILYLKFRIYNFYWVLSSNPLSFYKCLLFILYIINITWFLIISKLFISDFFNYLF